MPNNDNEDDNFDTEIDQLSFVIPSEPTHNSKPDTRTAIDPNLADRLLKAFPELQKKTGFENPAGLESKSPPKNHRASSLPRTVIQEALQSPPINRHNTHKKVQAFVPLKEKPSYLIQLVLKNRTRFSSIRLSHRILIGAILFAGLVLLGWKYQSIKTPIKYDATQKITKLEKKPDNPKTLSSTTTLQKPTSPRFVPQVSQTIPHASPSPPTPETPEATTAPETEAARILIKGQRLEALNLYQQLSNQFPNQLVYKVIVRVLERSSRNSCTNNQNESGAPCI